MMNMEILNLSKNNTDLVTKEIVNVRHRGSLRLNRQVVMFLGLCFGFSDVWMMI